ncbi:MAG TPA: HD domain-containing protein [Verrucomicrobiae bacterium]|jgi:putative hydrolase of HD superfamily
MTTDTSNLRLQQQFEFLSEADKLKKIERQNILTDSSRRENSAEHSWHLTLLAIILAEYAAEPLDLFRVVKMLVLHDLVEIDAGDTFVHTAEELTQQAEREQVAASRIFALLPPDQAQDMLACWREFEAGHSAEAKFAKSLDRVQPALLHEATDAVIWQKNGITKTQILARMKEVRENTPRLWPKVSAIIEQAAAKGRLHGS